MPADAGRRRRASPSATAGGSTSSRSTSATSARSSQEIVRERGWTIPVGWDRDGAVSEPLPRRRLPDGRLRLPGRVPQRGEDRQRRAHRAALDAAIERADGASPSAARGVALNGLGRRAVSVDAPPEAGWIAAELPRGVPGLALRYTVGRARLGPSTARGQGAAADALGPLLRARRRSTCATSRSPGPTGSSSATSGSTPTSSRRRSRSWRSSG